MEIEAWFLAEHTHFAKISPTITRDAIFSALRFDPEKDDLQARPTPADACRDLDNIRPGQHGMSRSVDPARRRETSLSVRVGPQDYEIT